MAHDSRVGKTGRSGSKSKTGGGPNGLSLLGTATATAPVSSKNADVSSVGRQICCGSARSPTAGRTSSGLISCGTAGSPSNRTPVTRCTNSRKLAGSASMYVVVDRFDERDFRFETRPAGAGPRAPRRWRIASAAAAAAAEEEEEEEGGMNCWLRRRRGEERVSAEAEEEVVVVVSEREIWRARVRAAFSRAEASLIHADSGRYIVASNAEKISSMILIAFEDEERDRSELELGSE
ncbi:unnamed protein product, partial [Musa acuminata subsp. burmannicoides]